MVDYALYAYEVFACDAVVSHQLLGMNLTKVTLFQNFLLLHSILEGNEIFRQFLCFEWFLEGCATDRAESHFLFLDLDKTFLAESVTAIQVARHS
jgi:hypothetical protein